MAHDSRNYKLHRTWWWIVLIIATAIGIYLIDFKQAQSANPKEAPEVELQVVSFKKQNAEATTKYIGYITPIHQVDLVPNVSGYISQVWAKGGQDVKVGDKLVLIDPKEYQASLDAAKAGLEQARATYANAKIYYDRIKKAGEKAVSKTEFDSAKAQFLSAQGAVSKAQAEVNKAKVMLDYTMLQSSINGTVGNVNLTPGNYVAPNSQALLSIVQYDPIRVVFSISDKDYLSQISSGGTLFADQKIRLQLADGSMYEQNGSFQFTDNRINSSSNAIAVYADFVNPQKELVANAYVDVLLEKDYKDVFLIPQNNAYLTTQGTYAYIIRNNQLIKVMLKILATVNNQYVVANQFNANDYLVIDKVPNLSPQTKVKPKLVKAEDK